MLSDFIFNFKFLLNKKDKLKITFLLFNHVINIFLDVLSIASVPAILIFILNKNEIEIEISFISKIVEYGVELIHSQSLTILLLLILIFFTIKTLLKIIYAYHITKFALDLTVNLSGKIIERKLSRSYLDFLKNNFLKFLNLMTAIVEDFVQGNFMISYNIIINIFTLIFYLIFLLIISFITTISLILMAIIAFTIYYFVTKKKFIFFGKHKLILLEKTISNIKDIFNSFKEIKVYGVENFFYKRFVETKKKWALNKLKFNFIAILPNLLKELGLILFILIIIVISLILKIEIEYIVVNISIFLVAALKIFPIVINLLKNVSKINYTKKTQSILIEELSKKTEIASGNKAIKFENSIILKDVSYSYNDEKIILENINLKINKGSFIGIRGESGEGKSTLVHIIMGLLNPRKGKIFIDNFNMSNGLNNHLSKLISYVPQKVTIINDSLRNNLLFGNDSAKITDKEILEVLEKVKLESIVYDHPKKLDTIIGETTIRASEGETQRFGIARALLQNREILILDEITSSLDEKNEINIMKVIKNLSKNSTIIMISHKSSTLDFSDQIYELKDKELQKIN